MSKIMTGENQTKNIILKKIVDGCIVMLISLIVLSIYEDAWRIEHTKESMFAIQFDMFSFYYLLAPVMLFYLVPNFYEFISNKKILYRYSDEKRIPTKLARFLRIVLISFIVILLSMLFTDKYSRVEFYDNGNIIEYNKNNEIINEYKISDIDSVEIRTNHDFGRYVDYWTEAVVDIDDSCFILKSDDYIVPDDYIGDTEECSLYGLKKVKETFSDKIKINTDNIDTLFEVEQYYYTKRQANELCEIFEVDYDEMMQWLEEKWGTVLEDD